MNSWARLLLSVGGILLCVTALVVSINQERTTLTIISGILTLIFLAAVIGNEYVQDEEHQLEVPLPEEASFAADKEEKHPKPAAVVKETPSEKHSEEVAEELALDDSPEEQPLEDLVSVDDHEEDQIEAPVGEVTDEASSVDDKKE